MNRPELLEVPVVEVRPYDVLDEGITVHSTTHYYDNLEVVLNVGSCKGVWNGECLFPFWQNVRELRFSDPNQPIKIVRGMPLAEGGKER